MKTWTEPDDSNITHGALLHAPSAYGDPNWEWWTACYRTRVREDEIEHVRLTPITCIRCLAAVS